MKINLHQILLLLCCCFLIACQSDSKPAAAATSTTPTSTVVPPKPGTVAKPADISRPDEMTNNFQRMQGEWQRADDSNMKVQVRGKIFLEIETGGQNSELANQFKVVKNCEGVMDLDGEFFMVGRRCYKIIKISVEEMEVEEMEQQKVIKYVRI